MNLMTFIIAAVVSLPRQFVSVYVGVAFGQSDSDSNSGAYPDKYLSSRQLVLRFIVESKSKKITTVVLVVTIIITIFAMRYIRGKLNLT